MAEKLTIYTIERVFKPDSKLFPVLASRTPELIKLNNNQYTLHTVLTALRSIISTEHLYDRSNTTLVMWDPQLEKAIGCRYNHVTEIRDIVAKQMTILHPEQMEMILKDQPVEKAQNDVKNYDVKIDGNARFLVKHQFRNVLLKVKPGLKQNVFTYKELTTMLSQYILNNCKRLIHESNIKIANVENDVLGKAFGVRVFHRTQITRLLRNQLIKVEEESSDSEEEVEMNEENESTMNDSGIEDEN